MSVERHALEAAITYAKRLECELEMTQTQVRMLRHDRDELQTRLNRVRDAARDRMAQDCYSATPMAPEATDKCCPPPTFHGPEYSREPSPEKSPC